MSELLSFALFLASVLIYAWKAGRNTWWFAATLTVLGLFVVLNITLFASDYFTGDGINDAVLYTLTNSLTGDVYKRQDTLCVRIAGTYGLDQILNGFNIRQ